MKKICVITTSHPADDNRIYLKEIMTLLKKYRVVYITTGNIANRPNGLEIVEVGSFERTLAKRLSRNWKAFRLALKQDVVSYHFHDFDFISFAVLLRIIKHKPVIYDIHEDNPAVVKSRNYVKSRLVSSFLSAVVSIIEKTCSYFFSGALVVNEPIKERISKSVKNTVVIPNYPQKKLLDKYKAKKYTDKKEIKAVHLGGLNNIRGAETIINGVAKLDNIKLTIIGDIKPEKYKEKLLKENIDKVEITGWKSYEEALAMAYNADFAIIGFLPVPNHMEASPNKIFEYMGLGLPILASDLPSFKALIEGGKVGVIYKSKNSEDFANKLKQLVSDKEKLTNYSKNAKNSFNERYNWESISKGLTNLYEEIIGI